MKENFKKENFKIDNKIHNIIFSTIKDYSMIENNEKILLMCSGGPDSTFLLLFFIYT
jgi:tRNA(Ile)-lysidine synthase TilS/MesJ